MKGEWHLLWAKEVWEYRSARLLVHARFISGGEFISASLYAQADVLSHTHTPLWPTTPGDCPKSSGKGTAVSLQETSMSWRCGRSCIALQDADAWMAIPQLTAVLACPVRASCALDF